MATSAAPVPLHLIPVPSVPVVEKCGRLLVVRDDLCPGGTKRFDHVPVRKCFHTIGPLRRRILEQLLPLIEQEEIVYAGHAFGYAALAIGLAALPLNKRVRVFYPSPQPENVPIFEQTIALPNLKFSIENVAKQHEVVDAAQQYCAETGAYYMPIGCASDAFRQGLVETAKSLKLDPPEVWCMCGSGLLTSALSEAFPNAKINAVSLGMSHLKVDRDRVTVYDAPELPEQPADLPPPFSSARFYDAKVWRFAEKHAVDGALLWNVAG